MTSALKGKKGVWAKAGAGGSYRGYKYERAAPMAYPTTAKQAAIGNAGREVGKTCKGKKGAEFKACRHGVMAAKFGSK
jgi:hypothetical protein